MNVLSPNLSSLHFVWRLICQRHSFYFQTTFMSSSPLITKRFCQFWFADIHFLREADRELITVLFLIVSWSYLWAFLTAIFHHNFINIHTVTEIHLFAYWCACCVRVCGLNWSSVAQLLIGRTPEVSIYRSLKLSNQLPEWRTKGGFYIGVCFHVCVCVYMWNGNAMKEHREAACASESEKYCVREACDCVCVCLNYLAQRPDRGVNEVRSSLLQRFSSLHPSISTPSTHQPSSSSSSSSLRRCRAPRLFCLS